MRRPLGIAPSAAGPVMVGAMLLAGAGAANAATITTSFDVTGAVLQPITETLSSLTALPSQTTVVSNLSGAGRVSATFTGPTLWTVVNQAGLAPIPGVKNASLRNVVVATGSDGYKVAFSGGELDPRFGGGRAPDLVATGQDGQPLGPDGFARTVVPSDQRGGRYVSNLSNLDVVQAPSNPSKDGGLSSSFTLSGLVQHPVTYDFRISIVAG